MLAEEGLFAAPWSADILAELRRNLLRYGIAEHAVTHRIDQMTSHFPAALVTGHERAPSPICSLREGAGETGAPRFAEIE